MKKTNKKNRLIIVLVVILLALAIGYATLTATLTLTGTASSGSASWDIHFKSARFLQADGTTVDTTHGGSYTISQTAAAGDTMTVTGIQLGYPGDGVLLEVVVENGGTMPAKLTGFTVTGTDTDFEVVQAAGGPTQNETLAAGGTCTATFRVKWLATSELTTLPSKTFTITYNYTQDTTEFNGTPTHTSHS